MIRLKNGHLGFILRPAFSSPQGHRFETSGYFSRFAQPMQVNLVSVEHLLWLLANRSPAVLGHLAINKNQIHQKVAPFGCFFINLE